jgi:quinol monooxygenase YgiN
MFRASAVLQRMQQFSTLTQQSQKMATISHFSKTFHSTASYNSPPDDVIRVLSERTMIRGLEGPVERLMERVQTRVRQQPGLISFQALVDAGDPNKFLVLTRWSSQKHLDDWLEEDDYKTAVATMDEYTEGPIDYKVMHSPKDDIFLL